MFSQILFKRHARLGLAIAAALCARSAMAQVTINFDENGSGTVQLGGGPPSTLISLGNQTDPFDPTNGLQPLTYNFAASIPGLVPIDGDINLVDIQNGAFVPSDLLRFEHGLLVVYSELQEPGEPLQLADIGIPQKRQQNVITILETGPEPGLNGMFGYAPGVGAPGDLSAPSIYNFISDPPFRSLPLLRS